MASSSRTPGTAAALSHFDYEAWVRRQPDIPPEALILEKPEADTVARIEEARRLDVETIVSGFLPDEIDWPTPGWNETLQFFVERFQFRPLLIQDPRDGLRKSPIEVLWVGEKSGSESEKTTLMLAEAWAIGRGLTENRLFVDPENIDTVAEALRNAAGVVNATRDWSVSFAVDEVASRSGRQSVRLVNPGYSPLRYVLLDQHLPAVDDETVPRIRSLLFDNGTHRRQREGELGSAVSLFGADATNWWRGVFGLKAFEDFWSGQSWPVSKRSADSRQSDWLGRSAAWCAINAAMTDVALSSRSKKQLIEVVADWLVFDQRTVRTGMVHAAALPRWIIGWPDWLSAYLSRAAGIPAARNYVCGWLAGVRWGAAMFQGVPAAVTIAGKLLRAEDRSARPILVAHAWAVDWTRLPGLFRPGWSMPATLRSLCAACCYWRCREVAEKESSGANSLATSSIWELEELWNGSFGGATQSLRFLVALRQRGRRSAGVLLRSFLDESGLGGMRGWARLVRVALHSDEQAIDWLARAARAESGSTAFLLSGLVAKWLTARQWDLWCHPLGSEVVTEARLVAAALRHMAQCSSESWAARNWVRLAAVLGEEDDCRAAIFAARKNGARMSELYWPAVTTAWFHRRPDFAVGLFAEWSEEPEPKPDDCFVRAVAAQLVERSSASTDALERLHRLAPEFGRSNAMSALRLMWVALLFKLGGKTSEAGELYERAVAIQPRCGLMWETAPPAGVALVAGWQHLWTVTRAGLISRKAKV